MSEIQIPEIQNENGSSLEDSVDETEIRSKLNEIFASFFATPKITTVESVSKIPAVSEITSDLSLIRLALSEVTTISVTDDVIRPNAKPEQNCIILRDMPASVDSDIITSLFASTVLPDGSPCPSIVSMEQSLNTWYVTFNSDIDAKAGLQAIQNVSYEGNKVKARLKTESFAKYQASAPSFVAPNGAFPPNPIAIPPNMIGPAGMFYGPPMGGFPMPPFMPGQVLPFPQIPLMPPYMPGANPMAYTPFGMQPMTNQGGRGVNSNNGYQNYQDRNKMGRGGRGYRNQYPNNSPVNYNNGNRGNYNRNKSNNQDNKSPRGNGNYYFTNQQMQMNPDGNVMYDYQGNVIIINDDTAHMYNQDSSDPNIDESQLQGNSSTELLYLADSNQQVNNSNDHSQEIINLDNINDNVFDNHKIEGDLSESNGVVNDKSRNNRKERYNNNNANDSNEKSSSSNERRGNHDKRNNNSNNNSNNGSSSNRSNSNGNDKNKNNRNNNNKNSNNRMQQSKPAPKFNMEADFPTLIDEGNVVDTNSTSGIAATISDVNSFESEASNGFKGYAAALRKSLDSDVIAVDQHHSQPQPITQPMNPSVTTTINSTSNNNNRRNKNSNNDRKRISKSDSNEDVSGSRTSITTTNATSMSVSVSESPSTTSSSNANLNPVSSSNENYEGTIAFGSFNPVAPDANVQTVFGVDEPFKTSTDDTNNIKIDTTTSNSSSDSKRSFKDVLRTK